MTPGWSSSSSSSSVFRTGGTSKEAAVLVALLFAGLRDDKEPSPPPPDGLFMLLLVVPVVWLFMCGARDVPGCGMALLLLLPVGAPVFGFIELLLLLLVVLFAVFMLEFIIMPPILVGKVGNGGMPIMGKP